MVMTMIKKEFEQWYLSRFEGDIFWSLKDDCYIPIKAHYMWIAWQEQYKKIYDIQTKLDIKDDALCALNLALDHAVEENRQLKESRENTVKMLQSVLGLLDKCLHL